MVISRDKEEWKIVKGYEGLYVVSNTGRVSSKNGIMTQYDDTHGYMGVNLSKKSKHKVGKVHRLVATAFISNPENKSTVNHLNGNKKDNSIENLEWATLS